MNFNKSAAEKPTMFRFSPAFISLKQLITTLLGTGEAHALAAAEMLSGKLYHRIGPGKRGVHGIHQRIEADKRRQIQRRKNGRYVW